MSKCPKCRKTIEKGSTVAEDGLCTWCAMNKGKGKPVMKEKIHRYLCGSNNRVLIWIKYWHIFDDCWKE